MGVHWDSGDPAELWVYEEDGTFRGSAQIAGIDEPDSPPAGRNIGAITANTWCVQHRDTATNRLSLGWAFEATAGWTIGVWDALGATSPFYEYRPLDEGDLDSVDGITAPCATPDGKIHCLAYGEISSVFSVLLYAVTGDGTFTVVNIDSGSSLTALPRHGFHSAACYYAIGASSERRVTYGGSVSNIASINSDAARYSPLAHPSLDGCYGRVGNTGSTVDRDGGSTVVTPPGNLDYSDDLSVGVSAQGTSPDGDHWHISQSPDRSYHAAYPWGTSGSSYTMALWPAEAGYSVAPNVVQIEPNPGPAEPPGMVFLNAFPRPQF